jgi:hypothetical protein
MRHALDIVRATRPKAQNAPDFVNKWVAFGASVRAAQYLVLGGKARALTSGRYHVSFDDIRALAHPVLRHRIITNFHAQSEGVTTDQITDRLLEVVPMPRSRGCDASEHLMSLASLAHSQSAIPGARFMDPSVLARIGNLELVSRAVVDGFINGMHKAPYFGASVDFAEHRGYVPGDDIRRVDWKLWARTDRYYVKEYEAESNSNFSVLLDMSKSMNYGSPGSPSSTYARILTACLTNLVHPPARPRRARDVRQTTSSTSCRSSAKHMDVVLHTLRQREGRRPGSLKSRCRSWRAFRPPRRAGRDLGLLRGADAVLDAIAPLRFRGND